MNAEPSPLGSRLAVLSALVATGALALVGLPALLGVAGLLAVVVGVNRGSRAVLTLGAGTLVLGVLAAGVAGGSAFVLLVATGATLVAWDVGEQAISLGEHLGAAAETTRADAAHALGSTAVAAVAVVVGYGVFRFATGGQPVLALLLSLLGAFALASTLRR